MFEIKVKANKSAEIYIYEDIGDGWMGGLSAKRFADEVKSLGKMSTLNVRINSAGGSVFDGIAIYNTLRKHSARVIVDIDALAASIASIIAMAGDEIRMSANSFMMVHDPWIVTGGNAAELREQADLLDKVRTQLVDTYVNRSSIDEDAISAMMAEETWLTADEALEAGLVDTVTEEFKMAARVHPDQFKHVPQALLERAEQPEKTQRPASKVVRMMRGKNMRREKLSASRQHP